MSVVVITKNPAEGVCPQCRQVKKFLEKGSIPFEEIMFDGDNPQHEELLDKIGVRTVPIVLPQGGYLTQRISLLVLMLTS